MIDFLFPKYCLQCHKKSATDICSDCLALIKPFPRHCISCATPLSDSKYCGRCLKNPPALDAFETNYIYNDSLRNIILRAKYSNSRACIEWISQSMQRHFPAHWQADCILPIPVTRKRRAQRGFNQVHYFSAAIAKKWQIKQDKTILTKKSVPAQSQQTSHKARRLNIKNSLTALPHHYKSAILIDDVSTSGATLQEVARILKISGMRWVAAFTLAATPLGY